ncbi:DUF993 family protein [Streptomyces sp. SID8377]|nr:DUF993 family protein [Streptomyces sp. SID8377]
MRAACEEQLAVVEGAGSRAVLMASRAPAAVAKGPEGHLEVCGHLLRQAAGPVVLLWPDPRWRSPTPRCGPGTGPRSRPRRSPGTAGTCSEKSLKISSGSRATIPGAGVST